MNQCLKFLVLCLALASSVACHKTKVMPSGPAVVSHTRFMLEEPGTFTIGNVSKTAKVEIDFGDGVYLEGLCGDVFEHTYTVPGDYTIVATIAGGEEVTKRVRVYSLLSLSALMPKLASADNNQILVMTHRAHSTDKSIPENSISAVKECIRLGVDAIEVDTHRTADGQIVICHDQTIDRTTNGSGDITKMNLADIKQYRLLDREGHVTNETMPTLEELLKAARGKIYVNLDYSPRTASTAEVLAVVEKLDMVQCVLMYCNTEAKVRECLAIDKKTQCYPWISSYGPLKGMGNYFVQLNDGGAVGTAENDGMLVTVNMASVVSGSQGDITGEAFILKESEVDGILESYPRIKIFHTDTPAELINYLESKGLKQ